MMKFAPLVSLVVVVVVVFATSGCHSNAAGGANKQERSRLKPLTVLYTSASTALRHPPQNEAEFKKYIASQKGKMLDVLHVDNAEELFTSERDGQPYFVSYGAPAGKSPDIVAYEKVGVAGKRMVGYASGVVVELDEEHFREAVPK